MALRIQTTLLVVVLLLLIAAGALLFGHQVNTLSHLEREYSNTERQTSELMKEWEILTFERWMLLYLGMYPRNSSPLDVIDGIETFIFYSNNISQEDLTSQFDPLAENFNITVTYLKLANQTNLDTLKDICNKTGFPEPKPQGTYLILLNSSKIICLRLEQVDDEVFGKCVEYLSMSTPET